MRLLLLLTALVFTLPAAPAAAELVRFELGGSDVRGVPATHEELLRRIATIGLHVSWQDQPYHDPYYSSTGGATVASLTVTHANDTVTVTWVEFDDVSDAARHAAELDALYSGTGYLRHRVRGRHMIQCYAHSGNSDTAEDLVERIVGR